MRPSARRAPASRKRRRTPSAEEPPYAELAALEDDRSRRRFVARHPGIVSLETVERLSEVVPVKVRVDVREAMALAEAAELIARKLRNPEALARGLRAKGNALHFMNDYKAAVQHHEEAARLFAKAGKPIEVGRTLSTSIQSLILLGEYPRAQAAAERARKIFSRAGDDLRLARLELNVGNVYHRQDRFAEALRSYEQAYEGLLRHRHIRRYTRDAVRSVPLGARDVPSRSSAPHVQRSRCDVHLAVAAGLANLCLPDEHVRICRRRWRDRRRVGEHGTGLLGACRWRAR